MKNIILSNAPELQRALATKIYCEIAGGVIAIIVGIIFIVFYIRSLKK